ncbi:hypothetical protein BaRGS_00024086, partial [Batillaria attramentaria]
MKAATSEMKVIALIAWLDECAKLFSGDELTPVLYHLEPSAQISCFDLWEANILQ